MITFPDLGNGITSQEALFEQLLFFFFFLSENLCHFQIIQVSRWEDPFLSQLLLAPELPATAAVPAAPWSWYKAAGAACSLPGSPVDLELSLAPQKVGPSLVEARDGRGCVCPPVEGRDPRMPPLPQGFSRHEPLPVPQELARVGSAALRVRSRVAEERFGKQAPAAQ